MKNWLVVNPGDGSAWSEPLIDALKPCPVAGCHLDAGHGTSPYWAPGKRETEYHIRYGHRNAFLCCIDPGKSGSSDRCRYVYHPGLCGAFTFRGSNDRLGRRWERFDFEQETRDGRS